MPSAANGRTSDSKWCKQREVPVPPQNELSVLVGRFSDVDLHSLLPASDTQLRQKEVKDRALWCFYQKKKMASRSP